MPQCQGKGYGKYIVEQLEVLMCECDEITLDASLPACQFYEHLGYKTHHHDSWNCENGVVPVEVKAATNTQAKSYKQFSKKYEPKVGFKASLKNIASNMINETNTISIPLYLLWNIDYYE